MISLQVWLSRLLGLYLLHLHRVWVLLFWLNLVHLGHGGGFRLLFSRTWTGVVFSTSFATAFRLAL